PGTTEETRAGRGAVEGSREEISRPEQLRQNQRSLQGAAARNRHCRWRSRQGRRPRIGTDDECRGSGTPREAAGCGTEGIRAGDCGGEERDRRAVRREKEGLGSGYR